MLHLLCWERARVITSVHKSVCTQLNWSAFISTLTDKLLDLTAQTSVCPTVLTDKAELLATDGILYVSYSWAQHTVGIGEEISSREKLITVSSSLTAPCSVTIHWHAQCETTAVCFTSTERLPIYPEFQKEHFNWKREFQAFDSH